MRYLLLRVLFASYRHKCESILSHFAIKIEDMASKCVAGWLIHIVSLNEPFEAQLLGIIIKDNTGTVLQYRYCSFFQLLLAKAL